jgi:hypothetical protein
MSIQAGMPSSPSWSIPVNPLPIDAESKVRPVIKPFRDARDVDRPVRIARESFAVRRNRICPLLLKRINLTQ